MKCPKCHFENPLDTRFCGHCAAPLHPSEDISISPTETLQTQAKELTTGSTFAGRYQVIEELGKGGMGRVYKVFDTDIKEKVALKLLKPEIAAVSETVERFSNELKLARKIRHKNVCGMFDLGKAGGTLYLTMEFVPGEDLKRLIRRMGQFPTGKAVSVAEQVCQGLEEAHRLGIVHRDLKPSNIMVDEDGNARIMDFGIARSLAGKGITDAGVMIGTPEYMSPEQVEGKEADQRSDIYSLGVILFEMVTGRAPFEGETPLSVAHKHKYEPPADPTKLNPQAPEDLSRLILRCLEKDREKRYQTVGELRAGLEKVGQGLPTTERLAAEKRPLTSREITVKFQPKKIVIPALAVLIVAAAIVLWRVLPQKRLMSPSPSARPALAILYFENISGDKTLDAWKTGLTELFIVKLQQSKFINVLDGNTIYSILKKLNLDEAKKYTKEDLLNVARAGGATHTLSGSIMKAGPNILLTLSLQKPLTKEVLSPISLECQSEEDIITKVDEAARKIKSDLDLSPEQIAGDIDKEAGKITTSSPQAYKFYLQGREFHGLGEYEKGISLMEQAIALDPEFAMAYYRLSMDYAEGGYPGKAKACLEKALALSDRVSERERYLIQGSYYLWLGRDHDKAVETFTRLLELYPDDLLGRMSLAVAYVRVENWDKAIEHLETNRKRKDPNFEVYTILAWAYISEGLPEKAREILEDYARDFSDNQSLRADLAFTYLVQGQYDSALAEANRAFSLNPTELRSHLLIGQVYLLKGDFEAAEREFVAAETPDGQESPYYLADLYLQEGKYRKAKEQIQRGLERSHGGAKLIFLVGRTAMSSLLLRANDFAGALRELEKDWSQAQEEDDFYEQTTILWMKGLAHVGLKAIPQAQAAADEIRAFVEKRTFPKDIRLYNHLQGRIELERKNYPQAIEHLKKAVSYLPNDGDAIYYDTLASACFRAGDLINAQKNYETIISLTLGRIEAGNIYARSFYMLGKIAEQKGEGARARQNYQRFLDLWKDADSGLPEVEDAKKRLSALGT